MATTWEQRGEAVEIGYHNFPVAHNKLLTMEFIFYGTGIVLATKGAFWRRPKFYRLSLNYNDR